MRISAMRYVAVEYDDSISETVDACEVDPEETVSALMQRLAVFRGRVSHGTEIRLRFMLPAPLAPTSVSG